jgi:CRISPR system Cascade subunit CasC
VEFGSGLFYLYVNIDRDLLLKNLEGAGKKSREIYEKTLRAFVESSATVAPTGKQNTFGSRAYAHYIMAEIGNKQPRNLSLAFINPVNSEMDKKSITALEELKEEMDQAYGNCSDENSVMDIKSKKGTLREILDFCVKD